MISATLAAAFIAGLAGSAHCFGMCGGMAGAFGLRAHQASASRLQGAARSFLYHAGRIGGYSTIGALGGAFGHSMHSALELSRFESALRVTGGLITLLIGLRILLRWNAFTWLERLGARIWMRIRPLTRRASDNDHWSGALAAGLLWGWLPCGLVYSMALLTMTASSPLAGAGMMAAFGLGTLPAMASLSIALGGSLPRLTQHLWYRRAAGTALIVFGFWIIAGVQFIHSTAEHLHSL